MTAGDIVRVRDGSYAVRYKPTNTFERYERSCGLVLDNRRFVVLLVQKGLPAYSNFYRPEDLTYTNDILLQDIHDPNYLVFSREEFVEPITMPTLSELGIEIAESLSEAKRMIAWEFPGESPVDYGDIMVRLADVLRRPNGYGRDTAIVDLMFKLKNRFDD